MTELGKLLIGMGLFLVLVGGLILLIGRIPGLGRLPGDLYIRRDGFTLYLPLATSLLVSLGLTVLINLLVFLFRDRGP